MNSDQQDLSNSDMRSMVYSIKVYIRDVWRQSYISQMLTIWKEHRTCHQSKFCRPNSGTALEKGQIKANFSTAN